MHHAQFHFKINHSYHQCSSVLRRRTSLSQLLGHHTPPESERTRKFAGRVRLRNYSKDGQTDVVSTKNETNGDQSDNEANSEGMVACSYVQRGLMTDRRRLKGWPNGKNLGPKIFFRHTGLSDASQPLRFNTTKRALRSQQV